MGIRERQLLRAAFGLSFGRFHALDPVTASLAELEMMSEINSFMAGDGDILPMGDRWPYSIIAKLVIGSRLNGVHCHIQDFLP
jgi:hypothetical protein